MIKSKNRFNISNISSLIALFLLLLTLPVHSQVSQDQCKELLSISNEDAKIRNYQAAYESWIKVLDNCPKLSVATYQIGERILKNFISKANSDGDKSKYTNDLLDLYDLSLIHI